MAILSILSEAITLEIGPNLANVALILIAAVPTIIAAYYAHQANKHAKESTVSSNRTNTTLNEMNGNAYANITRNTGDGNPANPDDYPVQSST